MPGIGFSGVVDYTNVSLGSATRVMGVQPSDVGSFGVSTLQAALSLVFNGVVPFPSSITFTRASTATYYNSSGVLTTASVDAPRIDYDPATSAVRGLLIEEQRTNLILNSATLSTQSVTVAATAHTLSFTGTGTVTLSGVSTAGPLVGTGANNRVSLTFTPTAGSLTLTVTGSVTLAQLEAGAFGTSYIPTGGSQVTRSADVAIISGANFTNNINATQGAAVIEFMSVGALVTNRAMWSLNAGATTDYISVGTRSALNSYGAQVRVASGAITSIGAFGTPNTSPHKFAIGYKANDYAVAFDGGASATDATPGIPTLTQMNLGGGAGGGSYNCSLWFKSVVMYNTRLPNATLSGLSAL